MARVPKTWKRAFQLGKAVVESGWVLLSGGRNTGVIDAVNKGAKSPAG